MMLMSVSSDESGDFRSRPRWSANRKIDVVLRLLRGESSRARYLCDPCRLPPEPTPGCTYRPASVV